MGQKEQLLFVLQAKSGVQTSPVRVYPPRQEVHMEPLVFEHYKQGKLHCTAQVPLNNLKSSLHTSHVPLLQNLQLTGHSVHVIELLTLVAWNPSPHWRH